jgi:hypothetical protein
VRRREKDNTNAIGIRGNQEAENPPIVCREVGNTSEMRRSNINKIA